MDHYLPPDLVDHIHSINITRAHDALMAELHKKVTHWLTTFEEYKGRRLETYTLIVESGHEYRYVMYSNGPSESNDLCWCLLHAYTVIKKNGKGCALVTNRSTMVFDIPIENRTVTHCDKSPSQTYVQNTQMLKPSLYSGWLQSR